MSGVRGGQGRQTEAEAVAVRRQDGRRTRTRCATRLDAPGLRASPSSASSSNPPKPQKKRIVRSLAAHLQAEVSLVELTLVYTHSPSQRHGLPTSALVLYIGEKGE